MGGSQFIWAMITILLKKCSYEDISYETLPEKEIDSGEKTTFFESDNGKKTRELDSEGNDGKKTDM